MDSDRVLPTHWGDHRIPGERRDLAMELAATEDLSVEESEDDPDVLLLLIYDEARELVGDEAIEALEISLPEVSGVDECVWADREIFEITGTIEADQLLAWVIAELATAGDPDAWVDDH